MTEPLFEMDSVPSPDVMPVHGVVTIDPYPYSRADGVAVAQPLNQEAWGGSSPTSALQLRFEPIDFTTGRRLVALWHSRLPGQIPRGWGYFEVAYVATFGWGWYAVALWTSPVALNRLRVSDPRTIVELRRFAICDAAPSNTASRMLGWMVRDLSRRLGVRRFISYQDTEVHTGTIYKAAGWCPVARSQWHDWNSPGRQRTAPQSRADKIRWERST